MDARVSKKETRVQPEGVVNHVVPDIFDFFLVLDGDFIRNIEVLEDFTEMEQAAIFASLRQKGSDSIDPELGVRWSEALLNEISPAMLVHEIKTEVLRANVNAQVYFKISDVDGQEVLAYDIIVLP